MCASTLGLILQCVINVNYGRILAIVSLSTDHDPLGERFAYEHTCWDPKDGELCLSRMKPEETLVEVRRDSNVQIDLQTWVQGRKTNRTIQQLVPPEISLRIAATDIQFYQVKRMIRGIRGGTSLTYSQTLNG